MLRPFEIGFGPLLLAQGLYTRWQTPVLPEAPGDRRGTIGSGPSLRLLIAGDSAAAGVGADSQHDALSGRLSTTLAREFSVTWRLIAETGRTTAGVTQLLREHLDGSEAYDVAVVSTGVNDVTSGLAVSAWGARLHTLVESLVTEHGVGFVLLSAVPPMGEFPALPQPLRWYLGRRAEALNRELARFAAQDERCAVLQLPILTGVDVPSMMARDGFHPGEQAYKAWGTAAAAAIKAWTADTPVATDYR